MSGPTEMTALQALQMVQVALHAKDVNDVACAWLRVVERLPTTPAAAMACYRIDDAAQCLHPIAGLHAPIGRLPVIRMDDLEHPAVYCLLQRAPCLIAMPEGRLHPAVLSLISAMKSGPALLALPLMDVSAGKGLAVLLLTGAADTLRRFQCSPEWSAIVSVLQLSLAQAAGREAAARQPTRGQGSAGLDTELVRRTLIGGSIPARRLRAEVLAAAESRMSVLITGETGTGKDHAALLIHQASARSGKAFVPLNCAAIAPELIGAELFGAAKGAYTGAVTARPGLVAAADGGTLYLDEIGDMPLALQGTLLRLINEKKYRPLGEVRERASDFRLICATHRPLLQRVRDGHFREDLYFRIRQLTLVVPPLRDRRADVPCLVSHVLARTAHSGGCPAATVSDCGYRRLRQHDFPGNIRELCTLIEVASERAIGGTIDAPLIDSLLQPPQGSAVAVADCPEVADLVFSHSLSLNDARDQFERRMIASRLRHFRGSRARTAQSLDIARRTLLYKCKRLGLGQVP